MNETELKAIRATYNDPTKFPVSPEAMEFVTSATIDGIVEDVKLLLAEVERLQKALNDAHERADRLSFTLEPQR